MKYVFALALVLSLLLRVNLAFAGDGVKGENRVSQELSFAHDFGVPKIIRSVRSTNPVFKGRLITDTHNGSLRTLTFAEKYAEVQPKFLKDLAIFRPSITKDKIRDTLIGYDSWIGLDSDAGKLIYNPMDYFIYEQGAPTQEKMARILLHEMGHFYNMDEDNSQAFANTIMVAYKHSPSNASDIVGGTTTDPVRISGDDNFIYTNEARQSEFRGSVQIQIRVGKDGSVVQARALGRPVGLGITEMATSKIKTWKFSPALSNGVPVATSLVIEVNFSR